MKSLWVSTGLLALLLCFSLLNARQVDRYVQELQEYLSRAEVQVLQDNWDAAETTLHRYELRWTDRQLYLHIIMEHAEIDEAEDLLASLNAFLRQREKPETLSALACLSNQLSLLTEMQAVRLGNVL